MSSTKSDEELERVEIPANLQPQLRLYRRLYLSRIDLDESKAAVEELLSRKIPLPRNNLPSALLLSLTTAIVVAYARPFVQSRGQSTVADKALPGVLLKSLTSKQRGIHDYLIDLRNKEIAHSDADVTEIYLNLFKNGDSAIFRSVRTPFTRSELRSILTIIEKLLLAIEQRSEELRSELPHQVWL